MRARPVVCLGGDGYLENSVGGEAQHERILPCVTLSPLSCSRVIFKMRVSNSALDKCSHTHFRRRVRSLRTQSSLVSRVLLLVASELKIASPPARIDFFGNNISPHVAAEASPERRGRRVEAGRGCAVSPKRAPDSRNTESKDAARRRWQ